MAGWTSTGFVVEFSVIWSTQAADPAQWAFWVLATDVLDEELGSQKSVGIRTLDRLTSPVPWSGLRKAVDACLEGLRTV